MSLMSSEGLGNGLLWRWILVARRPGGYFSGGRRLATIGRTEYRPPFSVLGKGIVGEGLWEEARNYLCVFF